MNKKTLNIISCASCYYAIKEFKLSNNFFDNDDFLVVDLMLFIGDITNLENGVIREFNNHKFKINNTLLDNAINYESIRIWSSRLDTGDYLSMLYCLSIFKDKGYNIKVIFSDDLSYKEKSGEEYKIRSLSGCGKEDIPKLLELETVLTLDSHVKYIDEWDNAIKENAPLRIMHNGVLIGIDYDFLDRYIFDELKKEKQMTKMRLCGIIMGHYSTELGNIGDIIIMTRIDQLIDDKKIKIIGKKEPEYFNVCEIVDDNNYGENRYTIIEMN